MNPRQLPLYAFLALAFGMWAVMEYDPSPSVPVASTMPAFTVQALDSATPVQWRPEPGKVTVINFFASWCVPCLAEHPQLKEISTIEDITVVGIAWNDTPRALNAWLDKHGNPFDTVWLDVTGRAAIAAGLRGVPETYVVDTQGKVRLHIQGAMSDAQKEKLMKLLPEWRDARVIDAPAQ